MNTESDITKKTRYHINLFSDYGIRRNTQSDITKWRYMTGTERDGITKWAYMHRISAYTGDAACHLAMAYIDGNGAEVDIEKAKIYLAQGEDRKHRFCIFKLAEIKIEEHILKTGGVSPSIHEEFNKLAEMARLGVGEACVSLHFFLKRYGQKLEAQGWECSKAYEITKKFMWALQLAYEYKPGEPYQRLVSALYDLGELGSGAAYFQAGKILEMNKQYVDSIESYKLGAFNCLNKKCLRKYIIHTRGEWQEKAIKWAKENCPIPFVFFYEFKLLIEHAKRHGIDLNLPENHERIFEALHEGFNQCINSDDIESGLDLVGPLLDGPYNLPQAMVIKLIKKFLITIRISGLRNKRFDGCLSRIIIEDLNNYILEFGFKEECIKKAQKDKQSRNNLNGLSGGFNSLDKIAFEENTFSEVEFNLIEEYGRLTLGCAKGQIDSLYAAFMCCVFQIDTNPRIKPAVIKSPRLYELCYAFLLGSELADDEENTNMQPFKEWVSHSIDRQVIDAHMAKENERWNKIKSRQSFIDWIGRGGRYSQRLFNEMNYSYETPVGLFQPWRPVIESKAKPDQLALTWNQDVLSACPIDQNWILYPNSALLKHKPLEDHINHLIELTKAGKYDLAKRAYTWWEFTTVETGIGTDGKFTYRITRPEDSIQLAAIAREMLFRGDYEESEKIIDYLIYTEQPPKGLLHHISAWLKYKQGKLSEAITMLQDCNVADLADSLGSTNVLEFGLLESRPLVAERTNANVLEYKLLVAELLLRDECLAQAADKIIKLKDICDKEQIYDVRISQLSEKIQLAHKQVTGQQVGLYQIAMSKMTNMLFTFSKNPIAVLQVPYFGLVEFPPNNMDRYRCLFPK